MRLDFATLHTYLPACATTVISNTIFKMKTAYDFFGETIEVEGLVQYLPSCEILGHLLVRVLILYQYLSMSVIISAS